jgi:phospholipid-transporting ATPase
MLSVCHTVIPEVKKDGMLIYQAASSPDESALVHAARHIGFALKSRDIDSVTVLENEGRKEVSRTWKILSTLEFNSTAQAHVVHRAHPGRAHPPAQQGAPTRSSTRGSSARPHPAEQEAPRGHPGPPQHVRRGRPPHALLWARGAQREKQYAEWSKVFHAASTLLVGCEEAVDAAAEQIDRDLTLVAASAI